MFNKTNLDTVLPTFKKVVRLLDSNYKQVSFQDVLLLAFLLNGKIEKQYQKYIVDYPRFVKIYNVAMQNKKSDYDEITLFTYGLEICLEANRYNQILKRSSNRQRKITKKWKTLKIKSTDDLVFNKIDIKRIIHPKDYYVIDEILVDAAVAVIAGEIKNTVTDVQSIVINLLNQNGISYSFNGIHELEELETKEKEVEQVKQSDLDIINKHLMRHQHINFEDQGKTNKKQNADELTSISLDYIKDNKDIQNKIKDNKNFESKLQEFISDYLESENKGDE